MYCKIFLNNLIFKQLLSNVHSALSCGLKHT